MPDTDPTEKLHGLNPGELLARCLGTVHPTAGATAWEPPTPEELAKLLPQYRIESLLGRGGMGAVYKGVQVALERPVAIKLLPAELAGNGDFLVRFQREARTLARLQHPGIVTVHDFGQTSAGHLYFVMEFVDGTDLQHILKGPGLQPPQAFEMIAQICDALFYAHGQGVIHRDIKPANILVTKAGRAKVADFGLARPLTEETGGLTATNVIMGTPDYMAPEQRSGIGHPDHRADIFALGVMLYEMLTGQRPAGAFQPPSHRVQVDVRIDEVVLKALQQEPDRRYQQASEMKVDVDRIRTTPPEKVKPAGKRRTVAALVGIFLAVALCATGIWLAVQHLAGKGRNADQGHTTQNSSGVVWQHVEHTEAEWQALGNRLENGWVHLDNMATVFDTKTKDKAHTKFAVRARVKFGEGKIGPGSYVLFERRNLADGPKRIQFWRGFVKIHTPEGIRDQRYAFLDGDEALVEAAVIDGNLYTRFNHGAASSFAFGSLAPCNLLTIYGNDVRVRDIEYVSLDANPDPLRALGWEVPVASSTVAPISSTAEEGFRPLFDGKTLTGWRALDRDAPATDWRVSDGSLTGTPRSCLMTKEEFGDFDFRWEWRVTPQGNGGVYFHVAEDGLKERKDRPTNAIEFQLVDDSLAGNPMEVTGSAEEMHPATEKASHPPGEWNTARLLVQGSLVEHWINDRLVCRYDLADPVTPDAIRQTKKGRLALQAWDGGVFYRNLRIREIASAAKAPSSTASASRSGNPVVDGVVAWVFKYDGEVTVRQGGHSVTTKDPNQIPAGRFDLTGITMRGKSVTEEDFALLGSVPTLQRIDLRDASNITSLKPLAGLTQLRYLSLQDNVGLAEEEVAHLAGLADLQLINLRLPDATGETFRHLSGLKKLDWLFLSEGKLTEAGGKAIANLSSLTSLTLNHCVFRDNQNALAPIGQMPKLKSLELGKDELTAEGFSSLASLKKLEKLNLSDSTIDNAGFALLTGSRGTMNILNVDQHATVSDEGIRHIVASFPNLEGINLSMGSTCTGVSIRELAKLPQLKSMNCWVMKGLKPEDYALFADLLAIERLSIDGTTITDDALQAFAKCEHLFDLVLVNNAITDVGLKALINIRPLKKLNVSKTKITPAGLEAFKKARPEVNVTASSSDTRN